MTMNLYWRPVPKLGKLLSDELKFALRKRYTDNFIKYELDDSDVQYLKGLKDAGIVDAGKLIVAIAKHGTIIVEEK